MREIKFRAWDKHNKTWITHPTGFTMSVVDGKFHVFGFDDAFADMYQIRVELQQYTGLKDKNDVEIYEGDIVTGPRGSNHIKCVVGFRDGGFIFRPSFGLDIQAAGGENTEVIGNIYENKELLDV